VNTVFHHKGTKITKGSGLDGAVGDFSGLVFLFWIGAEGFLAVAVARGSMALGAFAGWLRL
jgi:hypothetical protein